MADDKTTKTPEQPVTDSGPGKETPPAPPKEPEKVSVSPEPEKKTEPEVKNPQVSVYNFAEIMKEKKVEERAAAPSGEKPVPAKTEKPEKQPEAPKKAEEKPKEPEQPKRRGRPPKADKDKDAAPKPKAPAQKPEKAVKKEPEKKTAPTVQTAPTPKEPEKPKDAPRRGKEQIVYIKLNELYAFKNHPFEVRDDEEMRAMVSSVKDKGVTQPAIVRPREDGGYEIVSGHRRQKASELAGYADMPCIVRNLTDDEAITQMVEDNLNQREEILPSERAKALKMQLEAIKHQGSRTSGQIGAVDKVTFILVLTNKKDAHRRHPACFIIRFRFNAVADKRQWSSAASKPRRKTRAKLCSRFCAENEPSHQTCRSFSASRYSGLERRSRLRCRSAAK